jgi:Ca2+-binding EF-hand superfamily protein
MHACKRNLLALAVGAILLPAVALADKPTNAGQGNSTSQAAQTSQHPSMPTPAVDHAGDALTRNPQYDPAVTREVGKNAPPASERPPVSDDDDDDDDIADNDDDGDDNDMNAGGTASGRSSASAAQTNPGKGNWWDDADSDDDGRISRAEASANAGLDSRYASVDTDGDGYVTRDEYMAYYKANASQGAEHAADHAQVVTTDLWRRFDTNGDGRLSAVEIDLDARLKADFGSIDADDDGFVSDAEYRAYYRTD